MIMEKIKPGSVDVFFFCEACRRVLALTLADKTSLDGQSAPEAQLLERGMIARMMCPGCRYIDLPPPANRTFFPLKYSSWYEPLARILDPIAPPGATRFKDDMIGIPNPDFPYAKLIAEPTTILLGWFDIRDIMKSGDRLRGVGGAPCV
jgi:hypothetical protein